MNAAIRQMTEAHRLAQARLGAETVRQLASAWPILDIEDLDGTAADWLGVVVPLVRSQHRLSRRLAADYMRTVRAIQLGTLADFTTPPVSMDERAVKVSLIVTGPVRIKAALASPAATTLASIVDTAMSTSAAAGMRHALAGGRDTIATATAADHRAVGWQRVASPKACDFCAGLAEAGITGGQDAVAFEAHDGCSCSAEPVFA